MGLSFEERVLSFVRKNHLISSRSLVLIGVSGGADSMALLDCLIHLRHKLGVSLHAAHFNHRFRREAHRDQLLVEKYCQKSGVPLTIGQRQGGELKVLSEEVARQMRFQFFARTALRLHAQCIALGHTQNDLAETVLLRLLRGSGLYGLRAILPQREIDGVLYVRPLMGLGRDEVERYLRLTKTPFCTDTTNRRLIYERNKVRIKLLPLMAQEFNPHIVKALCDLAATAGEDYDFIAAHASRAFGKYVRQGNGGIKVDLKILGKEHPAVVRLVLRQMIETMASGTVMLSFEHIHALEVLMARPGEGRLDLSLHLKARKTARFLEFSQKY